MGVVGQVIDDVTTIDLLGRAVISRLQQAAVREQGPMAAMQAVDVLIETVAPNDLVGILTGFPIPPAMTQETDGPPGAVSVARAIGIGLDADAILLCDPGAVDICKQVVERTDLSVADRADSRGDRSALPIEPLPTDPDSAADYADAVAALDPAAFVAVEKAAPNSVGVYHNMTGLDITAAAGGVDRFLDRFDGIPTIGVGDGGNEVGMGLIANAIRGDIEYGTTCQCPCAEGIVSAVSADVLVPAAVSNWGAAAIAAGLAHRTDRDALHPPEMERRMLAGAAAAGAVDGIAGGPTGWCDALPPGVHAAIIRLLHGILETHSGDTPP